jgi:hypothetical protein
MTHTDDTKQAVTHTPVPWEDNGNGLIYGQCSGDDDEAPFVADVCNDPNAYTEQEQANAHRICAAVNACKGLSTEALERGIIAELRHFLGELLTAAEELDAALDGATDPFDVERAKLNAVIYSQCPRRSRRRHGPRPARTAGRPQPDRHRLVDRGRKGNAPRPDGRAGMESDPAVRAPARRHPRGQLGDAGVDCPGSVRPRSRNRCGGGIAMTLYNVRVYREMRLYFPGIEASSHEEAAAKARDRLTEDADEIEDCNGEDLGALVDVVGDDQYEQSQMIAFEAERLRQAAPRLLEAVQDCIRQIHALLPDHQQSDSTLDNIPAVLKARAAIATATAVGGGGTLNLQAPSD